MAHRRHVRRRQALLRAEIYGFIRTVEAGDLGQLDDKIFVCRAVGPSIERKIHDDDYLVFHAQPAGTRQGKVVLAQCRGAATPDTGGAFTVKRYAPEKQGAGSDWRHARITLSPANPDYAPIVLSGKNAGSVEVEGEFPTVLRSD